MPSGANTKLQQQQFQRRLRLRGIWGDLDISGFTFIGIIIYLEVDSKNPTKRLEKIVSS